MKNDTVKFLPSDPKANVVDLRNEPEIMPCHRELPQILSEGDYVPNMHVAVGFASRCWNEDGTFDVASALRIANELCAYARLLKEGKAA